MRHHKITSMDLPGRQDGFSLVELMISMSVLLSVSAIVMTLMISLTNNQANVTNRTEMHSAVRSVTETLQQEISQAGRVAIPGTTANPNSTTLTAAVGGATCPNAGTAASPTLASMSGIFVGELLIIGPDNIAACSPTPATGPDRNEEIVAVTAKDATAITATFLYPHANGARVRPAGAFATGILTTVSGNTLKMYGDINDDGNMVYIQYDCLPNDAGGWTLKRREMPWNTPVGSIGNFLAKTLLENVTNSYTGGGAVINCFGIQTKTAAVTTPGGIVNLTSVVGVAVTLTGRTEYMASPFRPDVAATTHVNESYDYETKALLNVSPRNVFQAWQMASLEPSNSIHVQPSPAVVPTGIPAEILALRNAM
jgi:prepilin-type N-terminal cleavage/methylation domain-containing protein